MKSLQHKIDRERATARLPGIAAEEWRPWFAADRYSRRVTLLKRLLPAVGLSLVLLVAAWPRLGPLLESVRFAFPAIDLRDARELTMVHPRYAGVDRLNRPYVLTAAVGRQLPDRRDLASLEQPRARMIVHGGAQVVLTAATGVYQSQAQLLDLFGNVTLTHQNGTRFTTGRAHVDFSAETARGDAPVAGTGPSGTIRAEGFRILNKGDTIVFTGRSHLLLKRTAATQTTTMPPHFPGPVAAAAARLAAGEGTPVAEPRAAATEPGQ